MLNNELYGNQDGNASDKKGARFLKTKDLTI